MRIVLVILFTLLSNIVLAQTQETKTTLKEADLKRGHQIAVEADKHNTGWVDLTAELEMTLEDSRGIRSGRSLTVSILEMPGPKTGDKSLVEFESPPNIKGTVLLTHAQAVSADNQWQFFPSLKRVKRISSANKSGPFMGSQFAYEDMSGWILEKYKYLYLGDDEVEGISAFMLEMTPQYPHSGYTRLVTWLDKTHYYPLKTQFYDRKNVLLKTQHYTEYNSYNNKKFWRAGHMRMTNHLTGKKTQLRWKNYRVNTGLDTLAFEKGSLAHR